MTPYPLERWKRKRRLSSNSSSSTPINQVVANEDQGEINIQDEANPESNDPHEEISVEEEGVSEVENEESEIDECLSNEETEDEGEEEAEAEAEDEDSDFDSESNLECELSEEDENSESNWEYEEDTDSDEETVEEEDKGGLLNMFSRLSVTSSTKDPGSTVSLHVKFARDCLWKRHLISRSEMENFGDEDVEFCVWRLESRLGQAAIEAHRKLAKILAHHIPVVCPPIALTLAEKLYSKEIQWSNKLVEIFLTWLYCGDGYCFIQTEEELLETWVALERLLDKEFNRDLLGFGEDEESADIYVQQRKSFMKLRDRLANLRKYLSELFDNGEDRMPLDRRFRVNQMYCHTLDKFDRGKYGYAFFGTSTMAYRHGVLWEGFHVFKQHHVFAQDITVTFSLGPQHEYAQYFGYEEMPEGPYNFRRRDQSFFRLVFVCDPEAEIRSTFEFLQHVRRVTDNAAKDHCMFDSADTNIEKFEVGICHSTSETTGETASNLNLQETKHAHHPSASQLYSIYQGDLRDLLTLVATGDQISDKQRLQASLIVRNPTEKTFLTIYGSCEIIGYCFEGNFLVVSSSVSAIESLIQGILGKVTSFNWRQTHSPRTILELLPLKISEKNEN